MRIILPESLERQLVRNAVGRFGFENVPYYFTNEAFHVPASTLEPSSPLVV